MPIRSVVFGPSGMSPHQLMVGASDIIDATSGTPNANPAAPANPVIVPDTIIHPDGHQSVEAIFSWDPVGLDVNGDPEVVDYYQVSWKTSAATSWGPMAPVDAAITTVYLTGFILGQHIDFRVRAVDVGGLRSGWTTLSNQVMTGDIAGPAQPSTPSAISKLAAVEVGWDGKSASAGPMDPDFHHVDVHLVATPTTAPDTTAYTTRYASMTSAGKVLIGLSTYGTPYYARLVAYDRLGNPSALASAASAMANPLSPLDATIPNPPTSLVVTPSPYTGPDGTPFVEADLSWVAPTNNTPATGGGLLTDLEGHYVSWKISSASTWSPEQLVPVGTTTAFLRGFLLGTVADFRVRARDQSGNYSAYLAVTSQNLGADTVAPPPPSKPAVAGMLGAVRVTWDGKDNTAAAMPADFHHVDVHVSPANGPSTFTPSAANKVGSLFSAGSIVWLSTDYANSYYFKLVAYDRYGNPTGTATASVASDAVSASTIASTDLSSAVNASITNAQTTATNANTAAGAAQTTADGRNRVFYQDAQPSSTVIGDLWFDTTDIAGVDTVGALPKRYSGGTWAPVGLNYLAVTSIDAAKITVGQLSAVQIAAGAITTEKLTIAAFSEGMLANASFDEASTTGAVAAGWTTFNGSTRVNTAGAARSGTWCILGAAVGSSPVVQSDKISVAPTDTFYASAWAKNGPVGSGSVWLRLSWRDGSDTQIAQSDVVSSSATTAAYQQFSGQGIAPTGAVFVRVQIFNTGTNAIYVDDLDLRRVTQTTMLADGSITDIKVNNVGASKLRAGLVNFDIGLGARLILGNLDATGKLIGGTYDTNGNLTSAGTASHIEIGATKIRAFNGATETVTIDGTAGSLKAYLGEIGGWTIGTTILKGGTGGSSVTLDRDNGIWLGNDDKTLAPFWVDRLGNMIAKAGTIGGWKINSSSLSNAAGTIQLSSTGAISGVSITGSTITAATVQTASGLAVGGSTAGISLDPSTPDRVRFFSGVTAAASNNQPETAYGYLKVGAVPNGTPSINGYYGQVHIRTPQMDTGPNAWIEMLAPSNTSASGSTIELRTLDGIMDYGRIFINTHQMCVGTDVGRVWWASTGTGVFNYPDLNVNGITARAAMTGTNLTLSGTLTTVDIAGSGKLTFPGSAANYVQFTSIQTSASAANMFIGSSGFVFKSTSSRRYKTNIKPVTLDEARKAVALRAVTFVPKQRREHSHDPRHGERLFGFIAEEAHDAGLNNLVHYDEQDRPDGFQYDRMVVVHQAVLQDLLDRVEQLELEAA